jgi:Family of unknown function (DUF6884)
MTSVGLVGCGKGKLDHATYARILYTGTLFRKASAYCIANYDAWFILSAKHGLLDPDDVIDPYDLSLKRLDKEERRSWAKRVLEQIDDRALNDAMFYIHAGDRYAEHLEPQLPSQRPLKGLGIGKQLAWYSARCF